MMMMILNITIILLTCQNFIPLSKWGNWQEVTMATEPHVNLSTCHNVFTVEKLILTISCPEEIQLLTSNPFPS